MPVWIVTLGCARHPQVHGTRRSGGPGASGDIGMIISLEGRAKPRRPLRRPPCPAKTELPVAGDRGVRIRLPPPAGLSWCGALLSAVVRESTAPFLGSSARGTEGSNPSPSSGESQAASSSGGIPPVYSDHDVARLD